MKLFSINKYLPIEIEEPKYVNDDPEYSML